MEHLRALTGKRILEKLGRMPLYWYVPLTFLAMQSLTQPIRLLTEMLNISDEMVHSQNMPNNVWLKYFFVVILGPFFETFLFQALPYYFLSMFQFARQHIWIYILVSSIGFGMAHDFSAQFIIITSIVGFFFSSTYVLRTKNQDPFLCTFLLHALNNIVSITLAYLS